jgi:hypothetical protein
MTTDMKAAIEKVRGSVSGVYPCSASPVDAATVLALAEIGRLAVEARIVELEENSGRQNEYWIEDRRDAAADAFIARQKGDK